MNPVVKYFFKILAICALFAFLLGGITSPVKSQARNRLDVSQLDKSKYPFISLYFWPFDGSGQFIKEVQPEELRIIENETVVAVDKLEMLEPGIRFIVSINEGPTLANRYSGVSRISKITTALTTWIKQQPATSLDEFSLITNTASITVNQTNPAKIQETISAYTPDLAQATPGLGGLSTAIDLAIATGDSPRKTPAILYVTPMPAPEQIAGLKDLITRADQSEVRLFIWLIGPTTYDTTETADILKQAAKDTDGAYLLFSGAEELPNLSDYLDPLKNVYKLTYKSTIQTSGNFNLSMQVRRQDLVLESNPVAFTLNVQPPNPVFLSLPTEITRSWTETKKRKDSVLTPDFVKIQFMLEFPDGMKRDLQYSRLFVDGALAAENTSAPFEEFNWDIRTLQSSGSHVLKVVVQDVAGIKAETIEIAVDIVVVAKKLNWFEKLAAKLPPQVLIPIVFVVGAGILLLLIAVKSVRKNLVVRAENTHRLKDPVTQPVDIAGETLIPASKTAPETAWPHIQGFGPALARLLLQPANPSTSIMEIPLGEHETTLGSNPQKAKFVLDFPLVSPLHARIYLDEQGLFRIADEHSSSGTWLNYAPVSSRGAHLQHGDLVQFGRAAFRFEVLGAETKKMRVRPISGN
jgi:hypothetical protein